MSHGCLLVSLRVSRGLGWPLFPPSHSSVLGLTKRGEKRGGNVWAMCPGSQNILVTSPVTCSGVFRERNILLNTFSHGDKTPGRNNGRKEAFIILAHSVGACGGKSWLQEPEQPSTLLPQSGNRKRWMLAPSPFLLFIQPRTPMSLYLGYVFPSQLTQARNCLIDMPRSLSPGTF